MIKLMTFKQRLFNKTSLFKNWQSFTTEKQGEMCALSDINITLNVVGSEKLAEDVLAWRRVQLQREKQEIKISCYFCIKGGKSEKNFRFISLHLSSPKVKSKYLHCHLVAGCSILVGLKKEHYGSCLFSYLKPKLNFHTFYIHFMEIEIFQDFLF